MYDYRAGEARRGERATLRRAGLSIFREILAKSHELLMGRVEGLARRAARARTPAQVAAVEREERDLRRTQKALSMSRARTAPNLEERLAAVMARAAEVARGR